MSKPTLKIGHLKITDHLILGVTKRKLEKSVETFDTCNLETVPKTGWNEIADSLRRGEVDGAFILAPTAMDIYKSGVGMKMLLFTHKTGSILVKNKRAGINSVEDFKGKVVLIPYQLSVHNMLFHRLLAEKGLKPGTGRDKDADVLLEVMAPAMMPQSIELDEEGEIGGFIVAEPFGSQSIKSGYCEEFALSKELWPDHPCCVFVMRDDAIGKYEDAVAEITRSLVHSGNLVEEKPDAAAKIGAWFLDQDVDVIQKVLTDPPDRIKTGELLPNIEDLDAMQTYMVENMGTMSSKIDMDKFVDLRFAQAAGAK